MIELDGNQIMQRREEAEKLAAQIKASNEWNYETCEHLCDLAGLEAEWDSATGDNFEDVVYKAAEILGVEI